MEIRDRWVDLRDASRMFDMNQDTLRKRIARGQLRGRKIASGKKYIWQVNLKDMESEPKEDPEDEPLQEIPEEREDSTEDYQIEYISPGDPSPDQPTDLDYARVLINRQSRTLSVYEELLTAFQDRINSLEKDNTTLNNQIKLLPAPPDEIDKKIRTAMKEREEYRKMLETQKAEKRKMLEMVGRAGDRAGKIQQENRKLNDRIKELETEMKKCPVTMDELSAIMNKHDREYRTALGEIGKLLSLNENLKSSLDASNKSMEYLQKRMKTEISEIHEKMKTEMYESKKTMNREMEDLRIKLETSETHRTRLETERNALRIEVSGLSDELKKSENQLNMMREEKDFLHSIRDTMEKQVKEFQIKIEQLEKHMELIPSPEQIINVRREMEDTGAMPHKEDSDDPVIRLENAEQQADLEKALPWWRKFFGMK